MIQFCELIAFVKRNLSKETKRDSKKRYSTRTYCFYNKSSVTFQKIQNLHVRKESWPCELHEECSMQETNCSLWIYKGVNNE